MNRFRIAIAAFFLLNAGLCGCGRDADSPTSPQQPEPIVYVAMGASDAVGIGAFPLDKGYVYKIRDGLQQRFTDVTLYNLGVSGKLIAYIESTELPTAIARQPNLATIWAGPNDLIHGVATDIFEAALARVLQQLRAQSSAFIVLANIPDLTLLPRFLLAPDADVTLARVNDFNLAIARQAGAYNVPLVDLYSDAYASDWNYVSIDGFHPSNEGHAKIAELYLDIILKNFQSPNAIESSYLFAETKTL